MTPDSQTGLGGLIDIFRVREYFDLLTRMRDVTREVQDDTTFLRKLRRAAVRLPTDAAPRSRTGRLWPESAGQVALRPTRFGIAATGGSGALASMVGVLKACEELDLKPAAMTFASGAALFAYPVAAGKTADEVAAFVLGLDPSAWIDPNWRGLAGILPRQGRGFAGVLKGARLEASYAGFLGDVTLGELRIPSYAPVWNIEHNRLEYLSPRTHARLKVARAIRMAVSLPLFFDPVRWRGGYWSDGGVVDIFPVHPLLDLEEPCDSVLAVNCFYPPEFAGEDASGWRDKPWSVLGIADQVVVAQHVQLARENLRRLRAEVATVMMIDPVPYRAVRRAGFYAQFLDRSAWPQFMRAGRRAALDAITRNLGRPAAVTKPRPRRNPNPRKKSLV